MSFDTWERYILSYERYGNLWNIRLLSEDKSRLFLQWVSFLCTSDDPGRRGSEKSLAPAQQDGPLYRQ